MLNYILLLQCGNIDWLAWISASAAVIAAALLGINLVYQRRYTIAQMKATDAQVKATEIQVEVNNRDYQRYLDQLLPEFKFTFEHDLETVSGKVIVEVLNNPAMDFYVKGDSYDRILTRGDLEKPRDVNEGTSVEFTYGLTSGETKETFWNIFGSMYGYRIRFTLFYVDRKRLNKYRQTLDYFYNTQTATLLPTVLLSEKPNTNSHG